MPAMIRIIAAALLVCAPVRPALALAPPPVQDDALASAMAGEFALQAGQLPEALRWYLQAAREAPHDPGTAEMATRIAMLANDDASAAQALRWWRERAPESLSMRVASATLALRRGDLRASQRELRQLLGDPDEAAWHSVVLALAGGSKDPAFSARVLTRLVEADAIPASLPAWMQFVGLAQRLDQDALAERMVAEMARRFPQDPRVTLLHAGQLRQSDRTAQARELLEGLAPRVADEPELRMGLAFEYEALGDPGAAARVLAMGPQDTHSYGVRAALLARIEDTAELTRLYRELQQESVQRNPGRLLLLGQIAHFLKRPEEALDWYAEVPAGGARIEARMRTVGVLHDLGRKEEAYREARRLQSDGLVGDEARRAAYLIEAELMADDKDEAGELETFERGLAAYPDDNELLYARALAWERRDRIDRAEADLRRILVSEPDNVAALNALGYTLADRTHRHQEALELIDRARAAEPDNAAIIDSYGWVLYRLGRNEEALIELRRAYTLMKDPEVAAHIGEVLWVLGKRDEARKYFDEARELDPDNRSLQRALEKTGA